MIAWIFNWKSLLSEDKSCHRDKQEKHVITPLHACLCNVKNTDVICASPKPLYGVLPHLFLIHSFSTLQIMIMIMIMKLQQTVNKGVTSKYILHCTLGFMLLYMKRK